uniref:Uncharacterized protein TCIL3000_11_11000 n=1 Tax=Trypanosoma congolense (strain IL3000) TaxID=1068625 RepID=G0V1U6_TRYCI|nr:unnamed protein product [Trypanosoma congolense IL3000]
MTSGSKEGRRRMKHTEKQQLSRCEGPDRPLGEMEIVDLFLSDVTATPQCEVDAHDIAKLPVKTRKTSNKVNKTLAGTRGKKRVKGNVCSSHIGTDAGGSATASPSTLSSAVVVGKDFQLLLEEGEDDPTVAVEVMRQTAAFLASLTPARSQKFWARRRLARGEEEENCEGATLPSSSGSELTDSGDDSVSNEESGSHESFSHENCSRNGKDPKGLPRGQQGKVLSHAAKGKKRDRSGALFNDNADIWDD